MTPARDTPPASIDRISFIMSRGTVIPRPSRAGSAKSPPGNTIRRGAAPGCQGGGPRGRCGALCKCKLGKERGGVVTVPTWKHLRARPAPVAQGARPSCSFCSILNDQDAQEALAIRTTFSGHQQRAGELLRRGASRQQVRHQHDRPPRCTAATSSSRTCRSSAATLSAVRRPGL